MRSRRPLVFPRLAARMAELDLLVYELAAKVPCHPDHVSLVLHGHRPASTRFRARVAEILEADATELFAPSEVAA